MKVGFRLAIGFGAVSLIVVLVVAMSLRALASDQQQLGDFVDGVNARAAVAQQLRQAVDKRAIAARNLVLLEDKAALRAEHKAVVVAHEAVGRALTKLVAMVDAVPSIPAEVRELVGQMRRIEADYAPVAAAVGGLARHALGHAAHRAGLAHGAGGGRRRPHGACAGPRARRDLAAAG